MAEVGPFPLSACAERTPRLNRATSTYLDLVRLLAAVMLLVTHLDPDPTAAAEQARQVGQKVLNLLAEPYTLPQPGDSGASLVEHHCTGTAGIALADGGGQDPDELIERADAAMYRAKQAGRNRLEIDEAD